MHAQCLRHMCEDVMFSALAQRTRYFQVSILLALVLQKGLRMTQSLSHNSLHVQGKEKTAEYRLGGLAWDPGPTICLREEVLQLEYQLLLKALELICWM